LGVSVGKIWPAGSVELLEEGNEIVAYLAARNSTDVESTLGFSSRAPPAVGQGIAKVAQSTTTYSLTCPGSATE